MNVLSIDGGGIRGIIPAMVLAELERRAQRPVAKLFDLVAGTSTGGILAAALVSPDDNGSPRWTAAELVELYRTEGPRIFRRSLWQIGRSAGGLLDEKHGDDALNAALDRYLGTTRLSQALTKVLVTAYDLEARKPYFFKSWRVATEPERELPMTVVARATSAAPTYFEPLRVAPPGGAPPLALVDGGVFATNPGMCAYAEVRRIAPRARVRMVSLGTGELTEPIPFEQARDWGLVEWVRPVIDVVFDGVSDTVHYQLEHVLEEGAYHRFQVTLGGPPDFPPAASDALDDASPENLERLQRHAQDLIVKRSDDLDQLAGQLRRSRRS